MQQFINESILPVGANEQLEHEEIHISKDDIKKLSKGQLRQLVMITSIFRDILLAQKTFLLIKGGKDDNDVIQSSNIVNRWSLLILLVSRIYAAYEFIEKDIDNVNLSSSIKSKLDKINGKYDKKVRLLFGRIRNKYGFHYQYKKDAEDGLFKAVNNLPEIKMWLCKSPGNDSFYFASFAEIIEIIEYMKKKKFKGENVPIGKGVFLSVVDDVDQLWADLKHNGYIDNEGVIQKAFVDLSDWRQMRMQKGYTDKQKDGIYRSIKHSGLFHELCIKAIEISGLLDDFLKMYLMEVIFKDIRLESKKTMIMNAPNISALSVPTIMTINKS